MKVQIVSACDCEGIYIDGKLMITNHIISLQDLAELVKGKKVQIEYIDMEDNGEIWQFEDTIEDMIQMYEETK